ncbi:hypothetical protein C922_03250 [Plasmodium inui San Antonio 1]|uniref:Uncharacterized protein n=1 Tax=Plasmodium inui San Antonio 1 TaxID=1237626 RepID=W7AB86_9APIC|nr:hypothetical protein C922_03250 [Plasmodium inui San Antonio 1]EUD66334.1 hypothetical protein C922_03250 [Plasmodium inui San Antonio 1]
MKEHEINGQIIAQGNYTRRAFQTNNIRIKTKSIVSAIENLPPKNTNLLTLNENLISKIRSDGLEIIKKEGEILDVNSKNVCYALKNGKFRLINQNGVNTTRIKLPYDNEVVYVAFNKENGKCLLLLDNKGHLYVYSINEYKVDLILCLNFPPYQKKSSSWTTFSSSSNAGLENTLKSGFPLKASWLPKSDNFFLTGHNNCLYIWSISLLMNVMTGKKSKEEVDVTDQLVAGCAVTLLFEPIMRRYSYVGSKEANNQLGIEADNTSQNTATEEKTMLNTYCLSLKGKYLLALVNNHYAIIWKLQHSNEGIKFTLVGFSSLQKELKTVKAMLDTGGSHNGGAQATGDAADHAVGLQHSEANSRGDPHSRIDQYSRSCLDVEISSVHILNSFFEANERDDGTNQSTYYLLVFHSSCCISVFPFNNEGDPSGGDTTERIDILRESSVQNIFLERDNVSIENIELFVDPSEFFVFFNISYREDFSHMADTSRSLIFILEIFNKKRLDFKIPPKFVQLANKSILPLCSIRLIKTNGCLKFSKVLNVSVSSSSLNIINLFMFSIIFNSSKKSVSVQSFSAPIPLLMGDVSGGSAIPATADGETEAGVKREGEPKRKDINRGSEFDNKGTKREEESDNMGTTREQVPTANGDQATRANNEAFSSSGHPGRKIQPDDMKKENEETVNIQKNIAHYEEFLNAIMTSGVGSQHAPDAVTGRGAITGFPENTNGGHQSQREVATLPHGRGNSVQSMSKDEMTFLTSFKRGGVDTSITTQGEVTIGTPPPVHNASADVIATRDGIPIANGDANPGSDEACVTIKKRLEDLMGKGHGDEAAQAFQAYQSSYAAEEGAHTPKRQFMGHPEMEHVDALTSGRHKGEQLKIQQKVCEGGRDAAAVRGSPDEGLESAGSNFYVEETPPQNENPIGEMQMNENFEKLEEEKKDEEVEITKRLGPTTSHRSSRNEGHPDALLSSMEGGRSVGPQGETNSLSLDIPLSPHAEAKTEVKEQEEKKTVEHNSSIDIIMSTHEDALRRFMECEDGGEPSEMDHPEKSDEENIPKLDSQHSINDGEVAAAEEVPLEEDIEHNEPYEKENDGGGKKEKNLNSFLQKLGFFKSSPSTCEEKAAERASPKASCAKAPPTVSNTNKGDLLNEGKDEMEKEKQLKVSLLKRNNKSDKCNEVCGSRGREHLVWDPTEGGTPMVDSETKSMVKKEENEIIALNKCSYKEREGVSIKAALSNSTPWDPTGEGQAAKTAETSETAKAAKAAKTSDDFLKQMCSEICRKVSDQMADIIYKEIRSFGVATLTKEAAAQGQIREAHLEGSINLGEKKSYEEMAALVSNCNRRMNEMMEEMTSLRNGNKNMNAKILSIGTTVGKIYDTLKGGDPHSARLHCGGVNCGNCASGHGVYHRGQKTNGYEVKVEKLISEMVAFKKGMYTVTSKLSETLSCMSDELKSSFAKSVKANNEQLKRWALQDVRHGRRDEEGEGHQMGATTENGVDYDVEHDRVTGQAGKRHTTPSFNKDMADFFNSAHQNAVKKIMPAVISSEIQIQFAKSVIPGMKEAYNTGFQSMKESLNSLLTENKQLISKELYAIEKAVLCEKAEGGKSDDTLISIRNKLEELQNEMKLFTFNMYKQISYLRDDINGIGKAHMMELADGGELDHAMLRASGEDAAEEGEQQEEEDDDQASSEEEEEEMDPRDDHKGHKEQSDYPNEGSERASRRNDPNGERQYAYPSQRSIDDIQNGTSSSSIAELKQEEDYLPPKPHNDTSDILIKGRINHLLSEGELNQAFTLALSIDIERNTNAQWLLQMCRRFNVKHLLNERLSLTQPVLLGISKILCESLMRTSNLTMEEADFRMKWIQECLKQLDVNHSDLVKTNSYIFVKNMFNNISAFSYLVGKEIGKLNESVVNLANLDLNRRILLNEDPHLREKKMHSRSGVEETEALASRNLYLGSPQKYYLHNKNMLVALQERLMLIRKLLKRYCWESIIDSLGANEDAPMCSR